MKYKIFFTVAVMFCIPNLLAQTTPKPTDYQKQLDKALSPAEKKKLEQQMKKRGMSGDLIDQYKKMMTGMMTTSKDGGVDLYENFTDNKQLVPARQTAKINSIPVKLKSNEEVVATIKTMYSKMMLKLPASEKTIITKIMTEYNSAAELTSADVTAMLQGSNQVAMGLSMQAVIAAPDNLVYQNNLAAILTENGYPENAIPFLKKLNNDASGNSTVLNNLGYAWLNLGEKDSAKLFFSAGGIANPEHPDVICGNGLVEELTGGDPKEIFEDAFQKDPNTIVEKMANNVGKTNLTDKLDYEKKQNTCL